ncbi:hypothetical protein [Streptomyces sp. NPDC048639]|uniref:hypothetical protein n=1 Tax=Streptomyces sp. NPDC048639 TaxID=3365581 RepID=UPI00372129B1
MEIDWAALGQVFGVSLLVTVGIVGVFTLGIVGSSRRTETQPDGTVAATGSPSPQARIGAYLCYALCAAAVAYGLYLIVA